MAKPRAAADAQNSRVKWWAIVQTVILFSICAVNVHVLKSWFEVKRVLAIRAIRGSIITATMDLVVETTYG
jgi:hypothetical protein